MKKWGTFFILLLSHLLFSWNKALAEPKILDLRSSETVSFSAMLGELSKAKMVFLGDDITIPAHQISQMEIIKALYKNNQKMAIAVEAFRSESQYILDQWSTGDIGKRRFVDEFNENWGDWGRYERIYDYIRSNKIKLTGINISRDILMQVESKGFDSLTPEQLQGLGEGIICDVKPNYQDMVRRLNLFKGILREQSFKNFCETKILGDMVMAKNLMEYHGRYPEFDIVVLAGNSHSWKLGIPNRINALSDLPTKTVLFEAEGKVTRDTVSIAEADYLWLDYGLEGWRIAPIPSAE